MKNLKNKQLTFSIGVCELKLVIIAFLVNIACYYFARLLNLGRTHWDLSLPLDDKIPFIPWTIFIYIASFLFWAVNIYLSVSYNSLDAQRFILAHIMGEVICFIIFVACPTTLSRPVVTGETLSELVVRIIYLVDSPDNLFPSLHCYMSWLCFIGVRKNKKIHPLYKLFSALFALAVCVCILTVKQHVIVDAPTGLLLAEISYALAGLIVKRKMGKDEPNTDHAAAF